jgi:hypothetical protein
LSPRSWRDPSCAATGRGRPARARARAVVNPIQPRAFISYLHITIADERRALDVDQTARGVARDAGSRGTDTTLS